MAYKKITTIKVPLSAVCYALGRDYPGMKDDLDSINPDRNPQQTHELLIIDIGYDHNEKVQIEYLTIQQYPMEVSNG